MNIWKNFDKHLEYRRKLEKNLHIPDVSNRYLVEYLNKGGVNRQTYIEAINEDAAQKGFFIFNDGTILSITDIRYL